MYKIDENGKVSCSKSGKVVAEYKDGNLLFMPGMVMQHKKKLTAYLDGCGLQVKNLASQNKPEEGSAVQNCESAEVEKPKQIQADPPFEKHLGVRTPGFPEWAADKTPEEINAMTRKLER